jgi:hypothetical protein
MIYIAITAIIPLIPPEQKVTGGQPQRREPLILLDMKLPHKRIRDLRRNKVPVKQAVLKK